jgi:peptidoglycan/LPS O-acetylase OafA/YrhL
LEFILGALTAALYMALRQLPASSREVAFGQLVLAASLASIAVIYLALFTPMPVLANLPPFKDAYILRLYFTFGPFVAAVLFCCARYPSWISAFLSRPWIVLCGEASYSIYLIHELLIEHVKIFNQVAQTPLSRSQDALRVLLTMLIVISVSLVTYRIIEVPARRTLRRLLTLRAKAQEPAIETLARGIAPGAE